MTTIEGFTRRRHAVNGIELSVQHGGEGPPLILLHGYPQNGLCWSRVASGLARHFSLIIPDLRGYGQSAAPADDPAHDTYSKRMMARDIIALMDVLGLRQASVLGHDRGARAAYRLALDHPARVSRLGIIEILPTADYWANWHAELALAAYHWTFLAQPSPLPERMIGADPDAFTDWTLASWTAPRSLAPFPPAALESYRAQARDAAHCAAMCADYRAGATTDRAHDQADRAAQRRITAPVHVLCAASGFPVRAGDPRAAWRAWADEVDVTTCDGTGHFVPEENPGAVIDCFAPFFAAGSDGAGG